MKLEYLAYVVQFISIVMGSEGKASSKLKNSLKLQNRSNLKVHEKLNARVHSGLKNRSSSRHKLLNKLLALSNMPMSETSQPDFTNVLF